MALLYMCGFDDLDTTTWQQEWESTPVGSIQTSGGRTGANFLRTTSTNNAPVKNVAPTTKTTLIVSFGFRPSTLPSETAFLQIGDTVNGQLQFSVTASGAIRVRAEVKNYAGPGASGTILGTSTGGVVAVNTWAWISILATRHASAGVVTIYVNGGQVLNLTGQNTAPGGTGWIAISPYCRDGGNNDFDDLIVDDDTGGVNAGIRADSRVYHHLPNLDGTTSGWTASTGATQFGVIDEAVPNGDTDYLSTATLNALTTVNVENFKGAAGSSITGMQLTAHLLKTDAGTCGVSAVVRNAGADTVAAEAFPSTTYRAVSWLYDTLPGGSAITEAAFNALEIGMKRTA